MLGRLQAWMTADGDGQLFECADEAALRASFASLSRVTRQVDLTPTIRSDLVGLHPDAREAVIDVLVEWISNRPRS